MDKGWRQYQGQPTRHNIFSYENVQFIKNKVAEVLSKEFYQRIIYDDRTILSKIMLISEQRYESIERMNERVVMELANEFRNTQAETRKHLQFANHYTKTQKLIDPESGIRRYDAGSIKLKSNKFYIGKSKVGGGKLQFYFTY